MVPGAGAALNSFGSLLASLEARCLACLFDNSLKLTTVEDTGRMGSEDSVSLCEDAWTEPPLLAEVPAAVAFTRAERTWAETGAKATSNV